jgi:hypothetical protein
MQKITPFLWFDGKTEAERPFSLVRPSLSGHWRHVQIKADCKRDSFAVSAT